MNWLLLDFQRVYQALNRVLPSFTEFYWVYVDFLVKWAWIGTELALTAFFNGFTKLRIGFLPSFTDFYRLLPSFSEFFPSFTRFI